ncbi:mechanosensitive ion channel family protein [Pseudemcibacter aquimaris]|uniref:mechanosensitive ion channel family protein n=1 Tax=Pseudemcibacter aquimaris TaxID=2857064 RepID=UPI0020139D98|nr:mechanosensitive ion channel family protein [Pseudemcibacter aquimaris]MCC3862392.1 mechanosensitive ion channel family protein [Pseudemcibacter aquimaris]WDU59178.1 mechanosensitive ion channel family protein [Pseudemcibacter aquimaris]
MDMTSLQEFWNLVLDVWNNGLYGVDVGKMLAAALIFFLFMLFRHVFSRIIIGRLKAITAKTETEMDDEVIEVLEGPLSFLPIVLGVFFATEIITLDGNLAEGAENLNRSLITFNIFWAFYNIIGPLSLTFGKLKKIFSSSMINWLIKAMHGLFIFLGAASILEIWGIQVAPLIAGLGLFGVAVALGAQDLFKNLISGIFIIGERRFHPGDWVKIDGVVEGTVEEIGFRTTTVIRFDKAPVYVPNAKLSDNAVTNFSRMSHRRIYWKIGLLYDTSREQLNKIRAEIEDYIMTNDDFAKPPEVSTFIRIDSFNDSSIDIMLYCFTKTTVWGEWLEIKEELALAIKEIVENNGSGFAYPSQSIYIENLPEQVTQGKPEMFPVDEKV